VEATCVAAVFIESRAPTSVIYRNVENGVRWRIDGVCCQCGECWAGMTNPKPVLDCPVMPTISKFPSCTLSGEYL
jgi:hypothetical protein